MKVVILAGGMGTRISEETHLRPKPMIEIGAHPILWHIMKMYSAHAYNDFVICLGYKGYVIKEYFANYFLHMSDVTFDLRNNGMEIHNNSAEPWRVTLVDTGMETMTGGRIKRAAPYLGGEPFMMTYGDGVSNVNISEVVALHKSSQKLATVTVVQPSGRFGAIEMADNKVTSFKEKPVGDGGWINGGFFVLQPEVLDYIENDATIFEREPMDGLVRDGQLGAYAHSGFWQPMDTLRDKNTLEKAWAEGKAPWKVWDEPVVLAK
jgi:glucose-1-phosphate cytidylyltransferase